ncbi:MAG TPA: hypothetical protein VFN67_12330, partial [Polyangiales bacterium]|nr:hypothetical protein [Polyangiales bacterium]
HRMKTLLSGANPTALPAPGSEVLAARLAELGRQRLASLEASLAERDTKLAELETLVAKLTEQLGQGRGCSRSMASERAVLGF